MKILVNRLYSNTEATLSTVSIDGRFVCFGLEDEYRKEKVAGETRIPAGTYSIGIRDVGGFDGKYMSKFPSMHKGMLQVLDVPGFEYILVHIGNYEHNTDGCLLVGKNAVTIGTPSVLASTTAYKELYKLVIEEALKGNVTIEYIDTDR